MAQVVEHFTAALNDLGSNPFLYFPLKSEETIVLLKNVLRASGCGALYENSTRSVVLALKHLPQKII